MAETRRTRSTHKAGHPRSRAGTLSRGGLNGEEYRARVSTEQLVLDAARIAENCSRHSSACDQTLAHCLEQDSGMPACSPSAIARAVFPTQEIAANGFESRMKRLESRGGRASLQPPNRTKQLQMVGSQALRPFLDSSDRVRSNRVALFKRAIRLPNRFDLSSPPPFSSLEHRRTG